MQKAIDDATKRAEDAGIFRTKTTATAELQLRASISTPPGHNTPSCGHNMPSCGDNSFSCGLRIPCSSCEFKGAYILQSTTTKSRFGDRPLRTAPRVLCRKSQDVVIKPITVIDTLITITVYINDTKAIKLVGPPKV